MTDPGPRDAADDATSRAEWLRLIEEGRELALRVMSVPPAIIGRPMIGVAACTLCGTESGWAPVTRAHRSRLPLCPACDGRGAISGVLSGVDLSPEELRRLTVEWEQRSGDHPTVVVVPEGVTFTRARVRATPESTVLVDIDGEQVPIAVALQRCATAMADCARLGESVESLDRHAARVGDESATAPVLAKGREMLARAHVHTRRLQVELTAAHERATGRPLAQLAPPSDAPTPLEAAREVLGRAQWEERRLRAELIRMRAKPGELHALRSRRLVRASAVAAVLVALLPVAAFTDAPTVALAVLAAAIAALGLTIQAGVARATREMRQARVAAEMLERPYDLALDALVLAEAGVVALDELPTEQHWTPPGVVDMTGPRWMGAR